MNVIQLIKVIFFNLFIWNDENNSDKKGVIELFCLIYAKKKGKMIIVLEGIICQTFIWLLLPGDHLSFLVL